MSEQCERQQQEPGDKKEETEFRVDEGWKRSVAEEREKGKREREQPHAQEPTQQEYPEPSFRVFLAGLYTQTLISLGEVEHPVTHKKELALPEARYLIDTINMLRQKTQGNLSGDEQMYLDSLLHDLRMRYVSATGRPASEQTAESQ